MGLTLFLIGLLYVAVVSALIAAGASAAVVIGIAAVVALIQVLTSARLALRSMGARRVTAEEEPELHRIIERLCQLADLPKPHVAVSETDLPNAFAAGLTRKSATVCVTRGMLERLDGPQLEAVVAHELSHIANRDVLVMTVASFLATIAGLIIRSSVHVGGLGRGRRGGDNVFLTFLVVLLVSAVVYALSFLLLRALSRYREYAADRGAAIMTGTPSQLVGALLAIDGGLAAIPTRDLRSVEGMNAFFVMPAVASGLSLSSLFSTHPPLERRIERLMAMQAELDRTGAIARGR